MFTENKSGTERCDRSDIIRRLITKEWCVLRVWKGDYGGCECVLRAAGKCSYSLGIGLGNNRNFHKKYLLFNVIQILDFGSFCGTTQIEKSGCEIS